MTSDIYRIKGANYTRPDLERNLRITEGENYENEYVIGVFIIGEGSDELGDSRRTAARSIHLTPEQAEELAVTILYNLKQKGLIK